MNNHYVEVRFWNKFNECICHGFQTSIDFDDMESAKDFVNHVKVKDCKQVTFTEYIGNTVINNECYDVLEK
jgi:hypothetical protein